MSNIEDEKLKGNHNLDIHMIIQGLDHLNQGISLFDKDLKLRLFNKKFQTMFDFQDGFLSLGMDFADIILFNIHSGEYGPGDEREQLAQRLEKAKEFSAHHFSRERPNGITIDVSGSPLPDGGFVTIYTDITEFAQREDLHKKEKKQTADLLQATLDIISQGISLVDMDMKIAVSNKRFCQLLDLPDHFSNPETTFEEITRYNALRGEYGPGDVEKIVSARVNLAQQMQPHHFKRERPNGTIIDVIGTPLPNIGFVTTYEDITLSELNKRAIEDKEEQFRTYLELSPVGALLAETDGTIRYYNSRLSEIFGYGPGEIDKLSTHDFYLKPEDRMTLHKELEDDSKITTLRILGKKKNKEPFPILVTSKKITIKGKMRIFSWVYDLTDLSEAERTIQHLSEQNQLILSAAGAGIFGIDNEGFIQFINPAAAKMLEYSATELQGEHLSKLFSRTFILPKLMTSQSFAGEAEMRCKSNKAFPIKFTITQLEEQDHLSGMVIVFDDISDRIAAEDVLRQAMKDIEKSSRAKSHFLSIMSHELRTPLNAIIGFSQILEKNSNANLTEQQLTFIDHLHRAGDHLLKLVNEAIDIATIESGQVSLSPQPIELPDLLENCYLISTSMANDRDITLNPISYPKTDVLIVADHIRLQQIVLHLLSNAIKFNKKGGFVDTCCTLLPDNIIRITITDTGDGIPKDERSDIFAPFNRLDSQIKGIEGTGLGLTLSKDLCEIMGGAIGFTTKTDQGSSFWIDFPYIERNNLVINRKI